MYQKLKKTVAAVAANHCEEVEPDYVSILYSPQLSSYSTCLKIKMQKITVCHATFFNKCPSVMQQIEKCKINCVALFFEHFAKGINDGFYPGFVAAPAF